MQYLHIWLEVPDGCTLSHEEQYRIIRQYMDQFENILGRYYPSPNERIEQFHLSINGEKQY